MEKTVIELFAGVGGFRCGMNQVELIDNKVIENGNWNFVWANQWEPATKSQEAFDCYITRFGDKDASGIVLLKSYEDYYYGYEDDKGRYYMDSSGYYVKNETVSIDRSLYTFDEQGYMLEYTCLQSNNKSSELKLNVSLDKKDSAANQLQNVLIRLIDNGEVVKVKVDGTKKDAKNDKGIISFDGKTLADFMIEYNVGVSEKKVYEVKKLDSDYFEE